ncbi:MAG: hydrogenase 4 subunit B [Gammaproteobacteria bacterium]|nr:hydrogenase 4 subunit B [Gammaproteobacteria bacterium]
MSGTWWVALAVGAALASAAVSLTADRWPRGAIRIAFALLGLSGFAAVVVAVLALSGTASFAAELPLGLPWLHWHLRLDAPAGFFLGLLGLVVVAVSLFGPGYVIPDAQRPYSLKVLGAATGVFVAAMQLVVLADDAFVFMLAWELMSVSSYLLVAYEHMEGANRRAAFLYLLMAQVGAMLVLLAFGVLAAFAADLSFPALRAATLPGPWPSVAFALALAGFGMKAGLVPLHVWLPEAHPVAPSHISALMSGVMLKVAIYGFVRFTFDLLGEPHWAWGVTLLVAGSVTALYGVLYALAQHDLKRLLAYHSVENIGIIYIGLGLAALFYGTGFPKLGVLGLIAALYHTLNHALFKSLLFLGAGVIAQRGHERNLEHMGGLVHRMPWTAAFFLIGCISISALPPFNGFVSEWLTFQTALQAAQLHSGVLRSVIPVTAAMLALSGALAAACFVKVYGIAFLGQARTRRVRHAREAGGTMLAAQALLAALCLVFGVLPTTTVQALSRVTQALTGDAPAAATRHGWLWLTPIAPEVASYSAPLVFLGMFLALAAWAAVYLLLRRRRREQPVPRLDAWECGFGPLSPRMQYSATAFAMPIREVFRPLYAVREEIEREMDPRLPTRAARLRYLFHVDELFWNLLYRPVERSVLHASRTIARIQTGNLRHYLAYSFFTLLALLWLVT